MTKEQQNVKEFMVKAGQATPDRPLVPDEQTLKLRIKLLLEEVFELAKASGVTIIDKNSDLQLVDTNHLFFSADTSKVNLVEVADGLCDIDYVNLGAAVAYGLDLEPFQKEVNFSNHTKFIDGYRREDGKFIKGPSYSPANLAPILEKQING